MPLNLPPVIGICGAMGAGKSAVAKELADKGYARISMASPLKNMLLTMGLTDADVHGPQEHRSRPSPFLGGKSPRHAMQTLGTQWGRKLISQDLWVNAVQEQIIRHQTKCAAAGTRGKKQCVGVVVEDIRFPNEWAMVQRLGGAVWLIRRPAVECERGWLDRLFAWFGWHPRVHESEYHWPDAPADAEFWNTGTEEELLTEVRRLLQSMQGPKKEDQQ